MKTYFFIAFSFLCFQIYAQNAPIIDALAKKDSETGAVVKVVQDEQINYLLNKKTENYAESNALKRGWSVQVFQENSTGAKDAALEIEKKIRNKFPDEVVRTERVSPFWRVRVGKFVTADDAKQLRELLIKEFPALRGSIYIVKFAE